MCATQNAYVTDINDYVKVGQQVSVRVVSVEEGKVCFSMWRTAPRSQPRRVEMDEVCVGAKFAGVVVRGLIRERWLNCVHLKRLQEPVTHQRACFLRQASSPSWASSLTSAQRSKD